MKTHASPRFSAPARNSLLRAKKIPCTFPAGGKIIPCSPTQGSLPQAPRIQGLFGAYLGEKVRIPCKFAARREFFPLAYPRGRMTGLEFLSRLRWAAKSPLRFLAGT